VNPTSTSESFTIFPAIDLRHGQVVRLREGDPQQETHYSSNPAQIAEYWLSAGATWLHVVNLEGAFGQPDSENQLALQLIIQVALRHQARIQFGGGLRTLKDVELALEEGVNRVILGTLAVEQPEQVAQAIQQFGADRVAVGLDARDGFIRTRGWQQSTMIPAIQLAQSFSTAGLRWLVFTDIARDGMQTGLNLVATVELAQATGLYVIASGGMSSLDDIDNARRAGLAGIIVGRALYEGSVRAVNLFAR